MAEKKKRTFKMPHVYIILLSIILLVTILTWVIPAGVYDFVEVNGKSVVDPDSFHYVEQTPVSLWDMFLAIPQGMAKNASLIFATFLMTGAIKIIDSTGALACTIGRFAAMCKKRLYIAVPAIMIPFMLLGAVGIATQMVAFIPLGLMVGFALGGDAIVGTALVLLGMNAGFALAPFGASSTGNAQTIAGIPLFSGAGFRIVCIVVLWIATALYILHYIKKINADPTKSVLHGDPDVVRDSNGAEMPEITKRRIAVLIVYVIAFIYIFYTAFIGKCTIESLTAVFIIAGIVCGIVYGYKPNEIARLFVEGCKSITFGALIIGLGATIGIILTNGNIIYTVVHALCSLLTKLPTALAAIVLNIINVCINLFIVSASGQAAAVMPILSPTAQVIGLTQQTTILCYQLGDAMTNMILPQNGTLMAALAIGNIPWQKWGKFFWKFLIIETLLGFAFITIAVLTNWGAIYG